MFILFRSFYGFVVISWLFVAVVVIVAVIFVVVVVAVFCSYCIPNFVVNFVC